MNDRVHAHVPHFNSDRTCAPCTCCGALNLWIGRLVNDHVAILVHAWNLLECADTSMSLRQAVAAGNCLPNMRHIDLELASCFLILSFLSLWYKVTNLEHLEGRVGCLESLLQAQWSSLRSHPHQRWSHLKAWHLAAPLSAHSQVMHIFKCFLSTLQRLPQGFLHSMPCSVLRPPSQAQHPLQS